MNDKFTKLSSFFHILLPFLLAIPATLLPFFKPSGNFHNPHGDLQRTLAWVCFWGYLGIPGLLLLLFLRTEKRWSQIISLELAASAILYFLLMRERADGWIMPTGAIILLVLSLYPLLQKGASSTASGRIGKLLKGLAQDWEYLVLVYYWSAIYLFSIDWLNTGGSPYSPLIVTLLGIPVVVILLILPGSLRKPLTAGGWLGIVGTLVITILLVTGCFTRQMWPIYLILLFIAYVFMAWRLWGREYPDPAQDPSLRSG